MSSWGRRLQRQVMPSRRVHPSFNKKGEFAGYIANPPRRKFWQGRGNTLGVFNPKGREYLARIAREAKRATAKAREQGA
jgi:hypothetical protein